MWWVYIIVFVVGFYIGSESMRKEILELAEKLERGEELP